MKVYGRGVSMVKGDYMLSMAGVWEFNVELQRRIMAADDTFPRGRI